MPILYVRNNCSACRAVEAFMGQNDLPFREVNIEENYDAAVSLVQDGIRSVPVLELETGRRLIGRDAILEAL